MADGQNERRAIRVAEITNDYRNLQHYIAQIRGASSAGDQNDAGYVLLHQCAADAQALLTANFNIGVQPVDGDAEHEKAQLQRIIVDASLRRFQAQRILQRATAATRWLNSRSAVLQGQKPHAGHAPLLQQVDNQLRAELASISDERIMNDLRNADFQAGRWIDEDPTPSTLISWLSSQR